MASEISVVSVPRVHDGEHGQVWRDEFDGKVLLSIAVGEQLVFKFPSNVARLQRIAVDDTKQLSLVSLGRDVE